jgi:hypothetical protein
MSTTITPPDSDMRIQALSCYEYANSFFKTFQKAVNAKSSRFDNNLLYNFAVMSFEKYFVSLLACYDWNATHHMPIALFREAQQFEPELTEDMKKTAILVGKFEAICSLDEFGYRTPSLDELREMAAGMAVIKSLVEKRVGEIEVFPA